MNSWHTKSTALIADSLLSFPDSWPRKCSWPFTYWILNELFGADAFPLALISSQFGNSESGKGPIQLIWQVTARAALPGDISVSNNQLGTRLRYLQVAVVYSCPGGVSSSGSWPEVIEGHCSTISWLNNLCTDWIEIVHVCKWDSTQTLIQRAIGLVSRMQGKCGGRLCQQMPIEISEQTTTHALIPWYITYIIETPGPD